MTLHILSEKETQEILKMLNEQFGIENIPGTLVMTGKEKIFLFQGSLNEKEIKELEGAVPVERVGIYFAKIQGNEIRLSMDVAHILKSQIKKNIFELENEKQLESWMHGNEILFDETEKEKVSDKGKSKLMNNDINNTSISERSEPKFGVGGRGVGGGKKPHGFIIMKYKNDFLGTGKASENKITNFVPKTRRLRQKDN